MKLQPNPITWDDLNLVWNCNFEGQCENTNWVCDALFQMDKMILMELESQEKRVVINMDETFGLFNRTKPTKFQVLEIKDTILTLPGKSKRIIYNKFSLFRSESVTHIKANNFEFEFLNGLVSACSCPILYNKNQWEVG